MQVLSTETDDGVATMTISIADDDHKFEVWAEGDIAFVEYQESLTWRGQVRVIDPDEDIYKGLMLSEEMTSMLNQWGVSSIKRQEPSH